MTTLTITAKGQVTLRKEVLEHLGLKPGDKVDVDLTPKGTATLTAVSKRGDLEGWFGLLHDPDQAPLSIDEMNRIIADGWAGKR